MLFLTSTLAMILNVMTALINLNGLIFNFSTQSENGRMPLWELVSRWETAVLLCPARATVTLV